MASSSERRGEKLKVFVSYARDDLDFADQLVSALEAFDFDLLIDRQGISAGEDWHRRLGALIAEADTVVFLLSPSAVQSEMCAWEIAETDRLSKRLFPVVIKPLGATPVPERFQELNYIFFYPEPRVPGSGFGRGLTALVQALSTDLDWVREHTRLGERAAEWQAGGQLENRLLSGGDVAAARAWLARRPPKAPAPTELHLDFIRASEDGQTKRANAERQRLEEMAAAQAARANALAAAEQAQNERAAALGRLKRNTLLGGGIALVFAIAALAFGWVAELQRQEADKQQQSAETALVKEEAARKTAVREKKRADENATAAEDAAKKAEDQTRLARANESRTLAALSEVASNQRYVDAVKLALAAWPRTADGDRPQLRTTVEALGKAQRFQRETIPPLRHDGPVVGATFDGDESQLLTWSEDGTARLWDARTGKQVLPPMSHAPAGVIGAAFNRDENRILTWSNDGTARLWDAATGKQVLPWLRHEHVVLGAAFNGEASRILTWSQDGTARLWDAATGAELAPPLRHEGVVWGAAFNGDESRILTWSEDTTARLWDAATGKEVLPPLPHGKIELGGVKGAAFSRDETRVLTWTDHVSDAVDSTARLWDAASGEEVLPPLRHEGPVVGATFNGDESRILTWSWDATARLWDAATGKEVLPPLRHQGPVMGATFNGDESRVVTWSGDGTVRLWDAASGEEVLPPLRHEGPVEGATFNGGATRILTWSDDGTARLWDAATGEEVAPPLRHEDSVSGATFDGDESRILTWSEDDTAHLWDAATGQELVAPLHPAYGVSGAAFNGDESRILTCPRDTARLLDISRLPRGNLIEVACRMLPDRDDPDVLSDLEERYGIALTEPICGRDTPAPVWTELVD